MRIAFVITPNMLATSLTNAYELFFAANQVARMHDRNLRKNAGSKNVGQPIITKQVELVKVAGSSNRITLPSGLSMAPDFGLSEEVFDMVYLPALWRNPRPVVQQQPALVDWVRWQYEHGAIINSTGTGVCFSAEAGLLNDKPATTHWYYFEQFARDYPLVDLKRQHFITTAGKIYCAASINALTDLTLHHVHRYFGLAVSEHLSRHFSHEIRQPFDRLSFNAEENTNHPDEVVLQAQLWMQNNLNRAAISMRKLSALFGMSQRNFTRRFKSATNMTPVQYLQNRRLVAARDLLKTSNLSIKEIAYRVGYLDVSYFTKLFKEFASITPKEYRTTVRARLFSSSAP
ncbi:MAG: helix-turn-helix domain-containing protein [Gammaproteobacteria bacterium]|nr:helix-turn-helix domain-containing protein [Gammaproteobacteria bacterium]